MEQEAVTYLLLYDIHTRKQYMIEVKLLGACNGSVNQLIEIAPRQARSNEQ